MDYVEHNGEITHIKNNELSLKGREIKDITQIKGLNRLTNLTSLNLEDNEIQEITGLNNLISLEKLYLTDNQIREIDGLSNLKNLKTLALGKNQIVQIKNISYLENLVDLILYGNKLNKIEGLRSLVNLQRLNLSYNNIHKIEGIENLCNLYSLILRSNKIRNLENLENLLKLKRLDLTDNQINEIKVIEDLIELEHIELSYNNIQEIKGLKKLLKLRNLNLSHNNIDEIKGLDGLKLTSLDLSYNLIKEIKGFEKLEDLKNLSIENNPIIDQEEFLLNRETDSIIKFCKQKNQLIKGIIGDGENETTEYKESFRYDVKEKRVNKTLKKEVTITACAMLNKTGGELFIGVNDFGEIKGIEKDLETYGKKTEHSTKKDKYSQDINKSFRVDLGPKVINLISVDFIPIASNEIVKITIKRSPKPAFFRGSDFFVRNGPASVKFNPKETNDYIESKFSRERIFGGDFIDEFEVNSYEQPKIDIALSYINLFEAKTITFEKQKRRILFICQQFRRLSDQSSMSEYDLRVVKKFIDFAIDIIKNYDDEKILERIYEVIFNLSSVNGLIDILRVRFLEIFSQLYDQGFREASLFGILVNLGFFDDKLINEIEYAVKKNDSEFFISLGYADISRFENCREILEKLILILEKLDFVSNKKIVDGLNRIIQNIQRFC